MSKSVIHLTAKAKPAKPTRASTAVPRAASLSASAPIHDLQRTLGNRAITNLLHSRAIQPKHTTSQPDDEYEREADRVADQVMRMAEPRPAPQRAQLRVQRLCHACGPKEEGHSSHELSVRRGAREIRRLCHECETESHSQAPKKQDILQAKEQRYNTPEVSSELDSYLSSSRDGGQPLPLSTRAYVEPRFGYDFSHVRIHTDCHAAQAARSIRAQAFTVGANVYFGSGYYDPASVTGQRLLSHELTHVIQQGNASENLRRQPDTCPQSRHEQADHPGTCPEIRRERGERRRFGALGPSVRVIEPLKCYVLENLSIGESDIGILRDLDAIADFLQLNTGATLHLTGFADCLGSSATNANLRTNRASAVEDYFINVLGVDRGRVFVEFSNNTEYLVTNETAIGRAANRAVAIYLELGPTPSREPESPPPVQPPRASGTLTDRECALQIAQSLGTAWLAALPNCPCTTALVDNENTTLTGTDRWSESSRFLGCFHPGAERCFRRDSGAHAQQCCYDATGNLITAGAAAGTPDFVPSSGSGHQSTDVWTWRILGWEQYVQFWVPNNGNGCASNTVTTASSCWPHHFLLASRPGTCAP